MRSVFSHPRFWLFAPFVALLAFSLLAFGLWQYASERIRSDLADFGLTWQSVSRNGFPARITFDVTAPRLVQEKITWSNPELTATLMPFTLGLNDSHGVVDFLGTHEITLPAGDFTLSHDGNLMSLLLAHDGLLRASFEMSQPVLNGVLTNQVGRPKLHIEAETLGLHIRRSDKQSQTLDPMDVAVQLKNGSFIQPTNRQAEAFRRLDILASVPKLWLQNRLQAGDILRLDRLTLERKDLTIVARGTLKLHARGYLQGTLDLNLVNLTALLDALQEANILSVRDRAKWMFLGGLGAALGGDTQDRLSVPLQFKNGRTHLGPLDLGPAPYWQ